RDRGGRLLRDWVAARLSGAARAAPLSRLCDPGVRNARLSGVPQRGMDHWWHLRHQQQSAPQPVWVPAAHAARLLLFLPREPRAGLACHLVADPLALGPRL